MSQCDIILLENVHKLGKVGSLEKVKKGYANYLIRYRKAVYATKENKLWFESRRDQMILEDQRRYEAAQVLAESLRYASLTLIAQGGEGGKLYGSITSRDIVAALHQKGFPDVSSKMLSFKPIRTLGNHLIEIRLHANIAVTLSIRVQPTENALGFEESHADSGHSDFSSEEV